MSFTEKELKHIGEVMSELVVSVLQIPEKTIINLRVLILKLEDKIINEDYDNLLMDIKTIKEVININE